MTTRIPTIGFIGAGKVGGTLARLWHRSGYTIGAIYSRSETHAQQLAEAVGAQMAATPEAVLIACDLTLLTVPDDALLPLAEGLAALGVSLSGRAVIHTSGMHDAGVLAALGAGGALVGSLHPAFPFADVETAVERLPGAAFAVEASDELLRAWLLELVSALNGRVVAISPGSKVLYHAALVLASNYTVTLYALAERLLMGLGAEREAADAALNPLMAATVENLRTQGVPDALTGPLSRADGGTIAAHLQALNVVDTDVAALYRLLAEQTLPLVSARGVALDGLKQLLQQREKL